MPDLYVLELIMSGHVERRDDGLWASYNNEFGFITHGRTRKEAIQEALNALDMVLDVYRKDGDIRKLRRWLDRKGVKYTLTKTKLTVRRSFSNPTLVPWGQVQKYEATARRPLKLAA